LPAELQRREERLQRIRQAKRALEKRIREEAAAKGDDPASSKPEAKAQYNFTDPESRILKGADGFVQGYNAQIAVESETQLIVGQTITQAANDKQQLLPMIDHVEQQAGQRPEEVVADNGYASEENLEGAEAAQIEVYVAVGRDKHNQRQSRCPRGPLPKTATRMDRMRRKLKTKVGRAIYATRKTIVEPVFGQIKQAQGFRQFLLRGLKKVQGEWALVCMAHNVLKVHRMVYT
jgi:IS5 family transposase